MDKQDLAGLPEHVQQALHEIREALRVQGVGSHGPQFAEITSYCARLRTMVRDRSREMLRLVHESGELKARAERAEAEVADAKRMVWLIVRSAGGKVRIPASEIIQYSRANAELERLDRLDGSTVLVAKPHIEG